MDAIWAGSISFGLVNIPVKMLGAVEPDEIKFSSLTKDDHAPVRFKRVNENTGKEVAYKDIVKGYEYKKGEFVIIDSEDLKKVSKVRTDTIDILQFSKAEEIDPLLFEKPYYLRPVKGGEKTYKLLEQALLKSGVVGVSEFNLRSRVHICIIRPYKGQLILEQLRYPEEIRDLPEAVAPSTKISDKELQLAQQLIKQLTAKFDPKKFKDSYVESVQKIIKAKVSGKSLKAVRKEKESPTSNVKDIMEMLKASIDSPKKSKAA